MTSSLREQIRAQSRIARIRQGQDAPEYIDIPSMETIRVAMVPLNDAQHLQGQINAAELDVPDNMTGLAVRNRAAIVHDVWTACRFPDELEQKVWESPQVMQEELDPADIDYLSMKLTVMMAYQSPQLKDLSDSEVADLKKVLETIQWRELYGSQAAAAKIFLMTLFPELLQGNSYSSTSTNRSTTKSENDEST
jgi:hypothetical protein